MAIINDRGALAQRILHSVFWQWSKTRQKNVWVVHLSEEHLILQLRYLELGLEHHYPDIACFNCIVAGIPGAITFLPYICYIYSVSFGQYDLFNYGDPRRVERSLSSLPAK